MKREIERTMKSPSDVVNDATTLSLTSPGYWWEASVFLRVCVLDTGIVNTGITPSGFADIHQHM
jgi:hypothetical protein